MCYIDRAGRSIKPTACLRGAYALQYVAYASLRGQKVQGPIQKTAYAGLRGPRFRISNERVLKKASILKKILVWVKKRFFKKVFIWYLEVNIE